MSEGPEDPPDRSWVEFEEEPDWVGWAIAALLLTVSLTVIVLAAMVVWP